MSRSKTKKALRAAELLKSLRKGDPAPVYFFHGAEKQLKDKAIGDILKVIPDGQRDFNVDRFYGGEADVSEVLTTARTLPFMASRRVVLLRDLEKMRLAGARAEELAAYLDDPSPSSTLVITTEDVKAGKNWARKFSGSWVEVDFRPLQGAALLTAVTDVAREKGVNIGREAAEQLVEAVGGDLGRINQEMEKLATAVGEKGVIGIEEVHHLVCGYAYGTMFDLVQAAANRDREAALLLADRLFQSGAELPGLVGMMARRFRILRYLAEGSASTPPSFRIQKWQLAELRRQASLFSPQQLDRCLHDLLRIDGLVKSAPVSPRLLLEDFLIRLSP